jgi:hypothetical protein
MKIDNFALTMFQSCPAKYFLRMHEGWTSRRRSAALGFGGALHEGLAEWYRSGDKTKALYAINEAWPANVPADDWRTKEKCIQTMIDYFRFYPEERFTVVGAPTNPMVECTFTLDTGLTLEDGEPIEYGGIFDGLVEWGDTVYVLEHKTTSQLGSYYFNQFKPNNQVSGYVWAAGLLSGKRVGGTIVNAIGLYKSSPTKFERQITSRSPENIREWLVNVQATCQQIKDCERRGYWPMYTGSCTMYGQCEFHNVHVLGDSSERERRLEQDYVREAWSYEQRAGVKDE